MKRIISVIIALLPLCSSCTTVTRMNIYPVPEESAIHAGKIPGSRIVTAAGGGREATGLFYRGGDRLAVILHGSGGTVDSEAVCAKRFIEKGYSILIPEYPGYGASKKYTANESDIYDDCAALITDIQRREKLLPANTLIYGRSLGAAVAVEMIRRDFGAKLICVTPFTSMPDLVTAHGAPSFIEPMINDQEYNNLKKAFDIDCPVLIVSGEKDKKVPHWMALKLNEVFPNSTLLVLGTDKHTNIYEDFTDEIWEKIAGF